MNDWKSRAKEELLRLSDRSGAWAYRSDQGPSAEPTALACLGLWSCQGDPPARSRDSAIQRGADWLLSLQNGNGSLGITASLSSPCWATAHAILLLEGPRRALAGARTGRRWLLAEKGSPVAVDPAYLGSVVGHDPTLIGWPWIDGTHSWVEPTAMAILALEREGRGHHPRVEEGIRVIEYRALSCGGWNYGNTSVFGRQAPTPARPDRTGSARPGGPRKEPPPPIAPTGHCLPVADTT